MMEDGVRNMDWFLGYWDDVISQWFRGHIEDRQQAFLDDRSLNLSCFHLPEPYWGAPFNCSIVIANYNPGGGADRNRHTYRECACCPGNFISQVRAYGYRTVAMDFPLMHDEDEKEPAFCWWKDYGGRRWWLQKKKWLQTNIYDAIGVNQSNKLPFALEFCGWHSPNWPPNACSNAYRNDKLRTTIDAYFVRALVDAVHNSESHLGLCVGSQFFHLFNMIAETTDAVERLDAEAFAPTAPCHIHSYRVYGEKIIVMWGQGRNRYPNVDSNILRDLYSKQ